MGVSRPRPRHGCPQHLYQCHLSGWWQATSYMLTIVLRLVAIAIGILSFRCVVYLRRYTWGWTAHLTRSSSTEHATVVLSFFVHLPLIVIAVLMHVSKVRLMPKKCNAGVSCVACLRVQVNAAVHTHVLLI